MRARPAAGQAALPAPAPAAVRRARLAVFWVFCLCGVICSLWSTSLPTINARLHLGETRLGFVLLMTGAGAVAVMPLTGRRGQGTRPSCPGGAASCPAHAAGITQYHLPGTCRLGQYLSTARATAFRPGTGDRNVRRGNCR